MPLLRKAVESERGKAYFYVYVSDVDTIEHSYGPYTDEHYSQLSLLSYALQKEFCEKVSKKAASETTVMFTADHGQVNVNPRDTIYLNSLRLEKMLRKDRGNTILPSGGARDVFLHVKDEYRDRVFERLLWRLGGRARIVETKEAIKEGLFGINRPKKRFLERVGDILILPYGNRTVWYEHIKGVKFDFLGHHGGLTKEEMLIPFGIADLKELKR